MTVRNLVLRSLVAFKWCFRSVWLWALLYLLAIPLFGFYFTLHGEEFRTAGPDARASTNLNRLMRELSVAAEHTLDNYSAGVPPTASTTRPMGMCSSFWTSGAK